LGYFFADLTPRIVEAPLSVQSVPKPIILVCTFLTYYSFIYESISVWINSVPIFH